MLACPITNQIKGWRFEVILPSGMKTSGVVLTDRIRVLDWHIRSVKYVESATPELIEECLAKLATLIVP